MPRKTRQGAGEYSVGFGKPPEHSRFRPGQSGNPRGRPKGVRNRRTSLEEALERPLMMLIDGERKRVSTDDALLLVDIQRALKGDNKAHDRILRRKVQAGLVGPEPVAEDATLGEHEQQALEHILRRRMKRDPSDADP